MKVFISSVITGFESYRDAAGQGVHSLGHQAIRTEDFQDAQGEMRGGTAAGAAAQKAPAGSGSVALPPGARLVAPTQRA